NPVLGYGLGVPYTYYEIISQTTMSKTFIHNGATALVYRYGVWGPPLILGTWLGALVRGYQAFRRTPDGSLEAALAFGCFLALTCLVVYSNTSNPFYQDDAVLMFALTAGLAAGLDARTRSRLAL
ncbi:MAG TPA: hypothetical protein VD948_07915, partial [Rhodothermales bacterium]|nr:hypothetical protein [Rhodothermales bacterium]